MKRTIILIVVLVAGTAALVMAYRAMSRERKMEAEREKPIATKSRAAFGTNGETILTLDEETQKRIDLKVQTLSAGRMTLEVKGYGRVLDPAPLAALAAELASAQVALSASQKEFDRLTLLNEQKNASDKAFQAAEAAARHDQIGLEAVRTRLVSMWGKAIAEQPNLPTLIAALAARESALVRIDLAAGEFLNEPPSSARIIAASSGKVPVPAQLLGPAPEADPQMQGQGFLFLVKAQSAGLVPGMAVSGYLPLQGNSLNGFIVPDSAVVRQNGEAWVYVQTAGETFTRRKILLDHPREDGWFVSEGVNTEDRVVTRGAQVLLSEEQKYQIRMLD